MRSDCGAAALRLAIATRVGRLAGGPVAGAKLRECGSAGSTSASSAGTQRLWSGSTAAGDCGTDFCCRYANGLNVR
ncbi:hypothetical protein [Paenibacillus lemnae]|uniref:Uncharacterized protein n=1 Tax=Paenibacillus lemnae TaxID=1330551 RepID=A0A848M3U3_PAELE|nr:hypothetical protein [Paenibacillus lemnae]NMO95266.1 hypothetical protein [Paenibacillus lemnae]